MDCSWRRTLASVFLLLSLHNLRVLGQNVVPTGAVPQFPVLREPMRDGGMNPGALSKQMNLLPCPPNGIPPEIVQLGLHPSDYQRNLENIGPIHPQALNQIGNIGIFPQGQIFNLPPPLLQGPIVLQQGLLLDVPQAPLGPIPLGAPFNVPQTPLVPIPLGAPFNIPQIPLVQIPPGLSFNIPQINPGQITPGQPLNIPQTSQVPVLSNQPVSQPPQVPVTSGPPCNALQAPLVPNLSGPSLNFPPSTVSIPSSQPLNIPQKPFIPIPPCAPYIPQTHLQQILPGPIFNIPQTQSIPPGAPLNVAQMPLAPIPPSLSSNNPQEPLLPILPGPLLNIPQTPPIPPGAPLNMPQMPLVSYPPSLLSTNPQAPLLPILPAPLYNIPPTPLPVTPQGPPPNVPQPPLAPVPPYNFPQTPLTPVLPGPPCNIPQIPLGPMPLAPPITNIRSFPEPTPNICAPPFTSIPLPQNIPPCIPPLGMQQGQMLPNTQIPLGLPDIVPLMANSYPQQYLPPYPPCTLTTDLTSVRLLPPPNLPSSIPIQNITPQVSIPQFPIHQVYPGFPQPTNPVDYLPNSQVLPNLQIGTLPPVFPANIPQVYNDVCSQTIAEEYNPVPINLNINVPPITIPEPKIIVITALPTLPTPPAPLSDSSEVSFEMFPQYPMPPIIIDGRRPKSRSWLPLFLVAWFARDGYWDRGLGSGYGCCCPCSPGCADIPVPFPIPIPTNNPVIFGNACRSHKKGQTKCDNKD